MFRMNRQSVRKADKAPPAAARSRKAKSAARTRAEREFHEILERIDRKLTELEAQADRLQYASAHRA